MDLAFASRPALADSLALAFARQAQPHAAPRKPALVEIASGEWVSVPAMSFRPVDGRKGVAAQVVFAGGGRAAVERIAAAAVAIIAYKVIELQALRNRPDFALISEARDGMGSACDANLATSPPVGVALPDVATVRVGNPPNPPRSGPAARRVEHWNEAGDHLGGRVSVRPHVPSVACTATQFASSTRSAISGQVVPCSAMCGHANRIVHRQSFRKAFA